MADRQTSSNRRYILRRRPEGAFDPSVLELVKEPTPQPGPGQALVRNLFLSLDPSNRIWMGEGESYMPAVPLNDVMRGACIGQVAASNNKAYPRGSWVLGLTNWQDYGLIGSGDAFPAMRLPRIPGVAPQTMMSALGVTGLTGYFGMLDIGKPRRGQTVVVSAAAGAVGSIAGQIARLRGARVVGIAGSREKCDWLVHELGFSAAVDRKSPDWREQLAAATPDGIDVDFENVGGEVMEAVFERLNHHARVVLCGLLSEYGEDGRAPGPRNFANVLMRRISIQGFNIGDYAPRFQRASLRMLAWLALGRIKDRYTMVDGLERAPAALAGLFNGDNTGKLIVKIAGADQISTAG